MLPVWVTTALLLNSKVYGVAVYFTKFGTDLHAKWNRYAARRYFAQGPSSSFDLNIYNQVEFEGNYNSDNEPQEAAPGPGDNGSGYDLNYFNRHNQSMEPSVSGVNGIINQDILEFVDNLKTIGSNV